MGTLRITRLGHGGILYRSPADKWLWVDRWSAAPTFADAYREPEQVDVVAPTHGHFDHVGNDAADVIELAQSGATVVGSHELSIYLAGLGVQAIGMNKGGTVEAAGIKLTMFHAVHSGGITITGGGPEATREAGCWGWLIEFEDGTKVYHSGDTDLFGDMAFVRAWGATIAAHRRALHHGAGCRRQGHHPDRRADRDPRPLRHLPDPGGHAVGAGEAHRREGGRARAGRNLGGMRWD